MLTKTVYQMIRSLKGSAQVELKNLYGTLVDVQNVTRILRLKRYFSAEPDFIRNNLLPYANIIPANVMERMIYAPDADAVMDIFLSTAVGRRLPKSQLAFEYDLHQRVPYFTARRHIHYSIHPAVVLMSYIFIMDIELDDIINIIEGIRYGLQPEEIKPMLVLANY
jgi:V/A-type H+-transporting ATPase subunit C